MWPDGYRLKQPAADNFDWWSLQPLQKPDVPQFDPDSAESRWIRTPIDSFIAAEHQKRGLTHAAKADRRTLVRRLYYDLIGLPPTPEEMERFVTSEDPQAWDRLVDQLLASDHLRRTMGTALAGCRQVRRYLRLRQRQAASKRLAVS